MDGSQFSRFLLGVIRFSELGTDGVAANDREAALAPTLHAGVVATEESGNPCLAEEILERGWTISLGAEPIHIDVMSVEAVKDLCANRTSDGAFGGEKCVSSGRGRVR